MRNITRRHGIVLIRQVKTGLRIAAGGAVERFGTVPDMVTLAKLLGGGVPTGAIGATEEVMEGRREWRRLPRRDVQGQSARMAAARASLSEVLASEVYAHVDHLNDRLLEGCTEVIRRHEPPRYAIGVGSKACVTFSTQRIVDYETFKANQDAELAT